MVGIGYRKEFSNQFLNGTDLQPDFIEVAPENWINIGGYWKQQLKKATDRYPLFLHGLSLSIGSPEGVDVDFVKQIRDFKQEVGAELYSEHLSFSKVDNAHLYDLLPIPFTEEAINHVVENIKQVQDILGHQIALENSSYYTVLKQEMNEVDFIREIAERADCNLLLDVNNVFVNAFNHDYNAKQFIDAFPVERVQYIHMAGHSQVSEDLIIDTHGAEIIDPVFDLFAYAMQAIQRDVPVLLERDFNIPDLQELNAEMNQLRTIKQEALAKSVAYE